MNIKCWNCGTEIESTRGENALASILNKLYDEKRIAGIIGDKYRVASFESAIDIVKDAMRNV